MAEVLLSEVEKYYLVMGVGVSDAFQILYLSIYSHLLLKIRKTFEWTVGQGPTTDKEKYN
jgi:hypothetical protein